MRRTAKTLGKTEDEEETAPPTTGSELQSNLDPRLNPDATEYRPCPTTPLPTYEAATSSEEESPEKDTQRQTSEHWSDCEPQGRPWVVESILNNVLNMMDKLLEESLAQEDIATEARSTNSNTDASTSDNSDDPGNDTTGPQVCPCRCSGCRKYSFRKTHTCYKMENICDGTY